MEPNADDDEEDNEETDDEYNESDDWPDAALGPDWKSDLNLVGCLSSTDYERLSLIERLQFIRNGRLTDIRSMINSNYPIQVQVNDDQWLEVDLVICAIGVRPNLRAFSNRLLLQAPDGGAWVDDQMRTSLRYVYAAGDCATVLHTDRHSKVRRNTLKESLQRLFNETEIDRSMLNESLPARAVRSKRWQQMRLWSQALQTGRYAGHSVACDLIGESPSLYACFDMFAHVTRFFDTKVVLLGRHRTAQLSEPNRKTEIWIRVQENRYLIKLIMQRNRLQGAVLIGDTDLEETIENLLYSQLNLRHLKSKMLLDNYDLEDFFD